MNPAIKSENVIINFCIKFLNLLIDFRVVFLLAVCSLAIAFMPDASKDDVVFSIIIIPFLLSVSFVSYRLWQADPNRSWFRFRL